MGEFYKRLLLDFTSIIYEALPFIVLGVVLAGLLEEFVPQQFMSRVMPKSRVLGIGLGALLGSIFPMCECGIVVVMRRLLRKGLPLEILPDRSRVDGVLDRGLASLVPGPTGERLVLTREGRLLADGVVRELLD